jgi:hypothetical protein
MEEAREKAKDLEKKIRTETPSEISRAASSALSLYYIAFNLNNIEGYSMDNLEKVAVESDIGGIRTAAADALESIYPNYYSASELIDLINNSPHESVKRGAAGALAIRYYSQMSPNPDLAELKKIASDETKNRWIREAAGRAFGELAADEMNSAALEDLVMSGKTEEIRFGAARAWSRKLIRSEKSQQDLLRMVCAATGFAPPAYRAAVTSALASRMFESGPSVKGG